MGTNSNTQNTTNQRENIKKLEGIFLPHARRHRDTIYTSPSVTSARFIHYTSAEAAIKIINQKHLWLRNTACMADYGEVIHGFTILQRFFSNKENAQSFINAINLVTPEAAQAAREAIKMFDQWWNTIRHKTFIGSVSEHDPIEDLHGRLSMWRAFGGNTARVGLVFNIPAQSNGAEAMQLIFCPVTYFKDLEADQLIPEVIEQIKINKEFLETIKPDEIKNWIFLMLRLNVTAVKHEGFREEKEWRVVHFPEIFPTPLITPSTEIIGGVPQLVYKLPLDKKVNSALEDLDFAKLFDRLIIGPSPYPLVIADAFAEALTRIGVPDARKKIFISGIPIRS